MDPICKREKPTNDTEFFSENWISLFFSSQHCRKSYNKVGKNYHKVIVERGALGLDKVGFEALFYQQGVYENGEVTKPTLKISYLK